MNCQFTLADYTPFPTVSDNCSSTITVTQSPAAGTVITATTTITLTADDGNGNTSTCTFDVILTDNTPPSVGCISNQNVTADANCQYTLLDYIPATTVNDNCATTITVTQSPVAGTVISTTTTVTMTADDGNGNTNTCTFDITPVDNTNPTITCPGNQNVSFDANCQYTLTDYTGLATTSDNCATTIAVTQSPAAGTVITGTTTITLTADDGSGNTSTCTFDVIPADTTPPTITCPGNQNSNYDVNCQFTLADYTPFPTVSDNCSSTITVTQSPAAGTVINTTTTITMTADDGNGNTSTCTFDVILTDNTPPSVGCISNQTVTMDANCQFTLADYIPATTTNDNCATVIAVTQTPVAGTVITGTTTITMLADDGNGNTNTCTFDIIPIDNTNPTITCPGNQNVNFDANCQFALADYTGLATTSDNCATTVTVTQSPAAGTLITTTTTITLTADDGNGNTSTCTFDVIPTDNIPPVITCPGNQNVNFDASCQFTLIDYTALATSSDNCAAPVTVTQSPVVGTVITGATTITLTADDGNGNTSTCTFDVLPIDNVPPSITCPPNQTVSFDANCQYSLLDYTAVSLTSDNCATTVTVTQSPAPGTIITTTTTITLTADDGNGNTNTCTFDIIPGDNTNPVVLCQNITAYLDASGNATVTTTDIDNGSNDGCGIASMTLSNSTFTCADVGSNTIYLIVTDNSGNVDSCASTVTVADTLNPTVVCQNINAYLDATGMVTILTSDIDNGSSDICGINTMTLSTDTYSCTEVGINTTFLIVTDNNGNSDSCAAQVTVSDTIRPAVICQDITAYLDATGNVTITTTDIDNGSSDACGIASMTLSTNTFTCNEIGANTIYLVVNDNNGNTDSCSAIVTVADTLNPTVICQNINAYLDATGNVTITPADVDNGSNDACGIASLNLSVSSYTCLDTGVNTTYLIAIDNNGNTDSCMATITVIDSVNPTVICQDIVTYLDATGNAFISTADIDNGTNDACGISNLSLSNNTFTCAEAGVNSVTLTATDNNGNTDSCTATVTVLDTIAPNPICQDITAYLDASGTVTVSAIDVNNGSTDACGIGNLTLSDSVFDCSMAGPNTVYLIVTDNSGNSDSCSAVVTVIDSILPTVLCQDISVTLDTLGQASITAADVDNGTFDFCGIGTLSVFPSSFDCGNVGDNIVTLTATDNYGNTDSCVAVVTVADQTLPTVVCQDATIFIGSNGSTNIAIADIDNGTNDACGLASLSLSETVATCDDLGSWPILLIAEDNNGNIDSCTATVTVIDNVPPTIICEDDHVEYLDENCLFTIPAYVPEMTDNCTAPSNLTIVQFPAPGTVIAGIGTTENINLTVTDESGNFTVCAFNITLADDLPPTFTCPDDQVTSTDYSCVYTVEDYAYLIEDAIDGCDFDSVTISQFPEPGTLVQASKIPGEPTQGQSTVTIFVEDLSGNRDSCEFTVNLTCITEIFIPQLFTPNNDGKNDILFIDGLEIFPKNELVIFNRWGEKVYEAAPYQNDWQGESTKGLYGDQVPDGSYFYTLKLNDNNGPLTGYIIIKR